MWPLKHLVLHSSLAPDVVAHRLRMAAGKRGLFSAKGKHFSGTVSVSEFELTPHSGGEFLPVFVGTIRPSEDRGSVIIVERRLAKWSRNIAIGVLILLAAAGVTFFAISMLLELWLLLVAVIVFSVIHYSGFTWVARRGERKLRELLEATDGPPVPDAPDTMT